MTDSSGTHEYATLADAADAALDEATITLLDDTTLDRAAWFDEGRTLTLDLAGHTITTESSNRLEAQNVHLSINGPGAIDVSTTYDDDPLRLRGSVDPVEDYTVVDIAGGVSAEGWPAVFLTGSEGGGNNGMVANIDGATLTGYYYAVYIHGAINTGTTQVMPVLNITNSTIIGDGDSLGMYLAGAGSTTIHNSTIDADSGTGTGIEVRAGSLTLTDTTVSAGTGTPTFAAATSGATSTNVGVAIAQHLTKQAINVTVDGGAYSGGAAIYVANPEGNVPMGDVDVTVTGGAFTGGVMSTNSAGAALSNFVSGGSFTADVAAGNLVADGKSQLVHSDHAAFKYEVLATADARAHAAASVVLDGTTVHYESLEEAQESGGEVTQIFHVNFDAANGDPITAVTVDEGDAVAQPTTPTRAGYTFDGWTDGTAMWNFTSPVTQSMTLTGVWTLIPVPPAMPTGVTVSGGELQALVSWSAAADADSYKVTLTQGSKTVTCTTETLSCAFVNLAAGSVSASVIAKNAVGDSPASAAATGTVTASAPPATPPANTGGSTVTSAPSNAAAGATITLVLKGFAPGSLVNLYVYSEPILLGSAIADSNGVATFTVKLPAGLAAGTHTLVGTGLNSAGQATSVSQTIVTTAAGGKGSLATTGLPVEQTTNAALLGVMLLAFGGIALVVRRRKATTK
ncbi:InlB B-repeat-containing protein [Microbacterium sp. A204]|uniref:InlB B-repeat-containing protein n=1 Tax=Microbacterium sp. A204 TaxID=3457321 RepID=UPI003FD106B0